MRFLKKSKGRMRKAVCKTVCPHLETCNIAMNRKTTWNEILRISRSMHQHASREDWDLVREMETGRQELLKAFFSNNPGVDEAEWIASGIHEILDLDKEIMQQGRKRLGVISDQLQAINAGKKADKEYRKYA